MVPREPTESATRRSRTSRFLRHGSICLGIAVLGGLGLLRGDALEAQEAPERAGIEITGTVVDEDDTPLGGIRVVAYPAQGPHGLGRSFVRGTGVADLDGAVVGRTARDGSYRLRLPRPGLWSLRMDGSSPAGDLAPARLLMTSALVRDSVVRNVALQLPEIEMLRVLDASGGALAGARVEVTGFSYGRSSQMRVDRFPFVRGASMARVTDAEGLIEAATAGRSGHALVVARDHLPVRVAWSRDEPLDEIRLEAAPWRSVTIVDPDGGPAEGAVAFVEGIAVGETDAEGRVDLPIPAAGGSGELVVLGAGQEFLRADLGAALARRPQQLQPARPIVVEVTSSATRKPLRDAWVWEDWSDVARTDADGRATLNATAEFFSPHHWAPQRSQRFAYGFAGGHFGARSGEVEDRAMSPVALALEPSGVLRGQVVDERNRAVRGATVLAAPTDMRSSMIRRQAVGGIVTRTDEDGAFELFSLDPGVELEVSARAPGFARAAITRSPLEVSGGPAQLRLLRGILASGTVVDEGGIPIVGAVARLVPTPVGGQDVQAMIRARFRPSAPVPEAVSNADGRFEFVDLDAASYSLEIQAAGFAPTSIAGLEVERWTREEAALDDTTSAPFFDFGTVTLIPGQILEGVVRSASGRAVSGAEVVLRGSTNTIQSLGRDEEPAEFTTEEDGRFAFDSLAADVPYNVSASATGFAEARLEGLRLPLDEAVELRLDPAASLRGRVLGSEGQPLEGASIRARGEPDGAGQAALDTAWASARTDADGRFELEDLARARWRLTVRAQDHVSRDDIELTVRPPETPPDLTIQLERGATLRGRITGPDGEAVTDARIQRRRTETASSVRFVTVGGASAADGRFSLDGLPLGPLSLSFSAEGYLEAVRDLEIQAGENQLDVQLDRGFSISGVVVDGEGRPVAGAEMAQGQPGVRRFTFGRNAATYSQADGSFELTGLASGLYDVSARKEGYAVGRTEQPVEIDGTGVDGVRIELSSGASVSGTVTGLDFDELGRTVIYASLEGDGGMPLLTQPDYEGAYRVDGLSSGRWSISAAVEDGKSKTESLEIDAGQVGATVDFQFGTGVELRGVVLRGEEPAAGVSVRLLGLESGGGGARTTDPNGRFVFDDVDPGTVELSVSVGRAFDVHRESIQLDIDREVVVRLGGGRLPLRVVDGESTRPLGGARVTVEREETYGLREWGSLSTGDDGRVLLTDLQVGEQTVHVDAEGYGVESVTTQVVEGQNAELLVRLQRASGVWITLLDAAGRPLRSGTYTLLDANSNVQVMRRVQPDANGSFRLDDLAPGARDVAFADARGTVARRTIRVPAAGEEGEAITVRLPPAGDLRVEIPALRGTQRPLELQVFDAAGDVIVSPQTGARRRGAGEVSLLMALPAGTVRVDASTRDGEQSWTGQVEVLAGGRVTLTLQ